VVVSVVVRSLGRNWTRNMLFRSNHSFWEGLKGQVVLRGLRSRIEAIRHR
jgi:hypothetical protein